MHILSCDFLIADVIVNLDGNKRLADLLELFKFQPGGKYTLSKEQFDQMSAAVDGYPITVVPGGSSANVLTTLAKLMPGRLKIDFISVVGDGFSSNMIKKSLDDAHIKLLPKSLPKSISPKTAMSYVVRLASGERIIATYPGNARDILKPALISDDMVKRSEIVLLQGALWQKLDWGCADRLLALCWEHGKQLWLALPTTAKFGEEKQGFFRFVIKGAHLVLANMGELARVEGIINAHKTEEEMNDKEKKKALQQLKQAFMESDVKDQVGFITDGMHGAYVVTKAGTAHIAAPAIAPERVINTVGAGDTAFAGFAYGYLKHMPHDKSAEVAMKLAGEKVKINGPRLPDPLNILKK